MASSFAMNHALTLGGPYTESHWYCYTKTARLSKGLGARLLIPRRTYLASSIGLELRTSLRCITSTLFPDAYLYSPTYAPI